MSQALLFIQIFAALTVFHFLADFPLQQQFLAEAKSCVKPTPGVPWWIAMSAHCAIHAGFVWFVTGSFICGLLEFVAHFFTDWEKCEGKLTFGQDQLLHLAFKALWVYMAIGWGVTSPIIH